MSPSERVCLSRPKMEEAKTPEAPLNAYDYETEKL